MDISTDELIFLVQIMEYKVQRGDTIAHVSKTWAATGRR